MPASSPPPTPPANASSPRDRGPESLPPELREAWERRATRELGGEPPSRLRRRLADGVTIEPLYSLGDDGSASHRAAVAGDPGAWPFLRGAGQGGWRLRQRIDAPTPAAANADALGELAGGADSLWIRVDEGIQGGLAATAAPRPVRPGVALATAEDLEVLLAGIDPAAVDAVIECGAAAPTIARALLELGAARGLDPASLRLTVAGDPLGAFAIHGELPGGLDAALDQLVATSERLAVAAPQLRSVLLSAIPFADAGASPSLEVAIVLSGLLEHLRRFAAQGIAAAAVAPRLLAALVVDRQLFVSVAKIRACRLLAGRVLVASGVPVAAAILPLHVEGSWRELTAIDPWVNLLRGTTAAFVAAVSGVESAAVAPFTAALGHPEAMARRIARNTQLLLREESGLHRVADPLGGAWYVESLTDALARGAWALVQEIEAEGGLAAALSSGWIQRRIAASAGDEAAAVACGRVAITGVNRYAILDETRPPVAAPAEFVDGPVESEGRTRNPRALARSRLAAPFEVLRRGGEHRARLVCVGALAELKPRIDFVRALLASGGIASEAPEAPAADAAAALAALATLGEAPRAVVIIAADDAYPELVPILVPALRQAGARVIAIAGRPRTEEAAAALAAAGVTLSLARGADALAALIALRGDQPPPDGPPSAGPSAAEEQ